MWIDEKHEFFVMDSLFMFEWDGLVKHVHNECFAAAWFAETVDAFKFVDRFRWEFIDVY